MTQQRSSSASRKEFVRRSTSDKDDLVAGPMITAALVTELVGTQFPAWAELPVRPVELDGWDNRTFRLGQDMAVRLPSSETCAGQVGKEDRWLSVLAPRLPLPIPEPLALGVPSGIFPWPWSVRRWLPGDPATAERVDDLAGLAADLAGFLLALQGIDAGGGPPPGAHNFYRGGSLQVYDAETREAITALGTGIDGAQAERVWETATGTEWDGPGVWVHGDVTPSNLLAIGGRLGAVIDFGGCGVGDPACDLTMAWTVFTGRARGLFKARMALDDGTWARARGWALWKALVTLRQGPTRAEAARLRFGWRWPPTEVTEQIILDDGA